MYVYISIYTYMHACICLYICMYISVYMYLCLHTHTHTHIYIYMDYIGIIFPYSQLLCPGPASPWKTVQELLAQAAEALNMSLQLAVQTTETAGTIIPR